MVRNKKIDLLRFIGLSMIIFAHVGPSGFLFQARNFDVPLMVFVAGISYFVSYKPAGYFAYIVGRFKRLVLPVWFFLTLYFFVSHLTGFPVDFPSASVVFSSYFLLNGIGYVWIVRVFLMVAIIAPLIYRYSSRQPSNFRYLIWLLVFLIVYEFVFYTVEFSNEAVSFIAEDFVFYLIPYSLVFAFGVRLIKLQTREIVFVAILFLACFLGIAFFEYLTTDVIVSTQGFKYPPRFYYLSYALFVSVFLWLFSEKLYCFVVKIRFESVVLFVANNSIWVYLWHIPFVGLFKYNVFVNWFSVFGCAVLVAYSQVFVVSNFILPKIKSVKLARDFRTVFTG